MDEAEMTIDDVMELAVLFARAVRDGEDETGEEYDEFRANIRALVDDCDGTWKHAVINGLLVSRRYLPEHENDPRAAILALLDAEAEACAGLCDLERVDALKVGMSDGAKPDKRAVYAVAAAYAATCRDNIRARIAARKGGAQP